MAKKTKKKAASVIADFGHKEAKSGGGRVRLPEGDYVAKILKAEQKEASTGNQMIVWTLQIVSEGKGKGKKIKTNTVLTPKALFMLRNLLEALGVTVPESKTKVTYSKYIGKLIGITLTDNEYKNKISSEVSDFLDPDMVGADEDAEDDDDEDDEDSDDDDDEDDDDEEDEDLDEVDLDEL